MLKITRISTQKFRIEGSINGNEDWASPLSEAPAGTVLECSAIELINSQGVKGWLRFFAAPERSVGQFVFTELAVPLVEQLNMFKNFVGPGRVESIALPYRCAKCQADFNPVSTCDEAKAFLPYPPARACPQCGGTAHFDDIAEEYFQFLGRS